MFAVANPHSRQPDLCPKTVKLMLPLKAPKFALPAAFHKPKQPAHELKRRRTATFAHAPRAKVAWEDVGSG
jgi:hypothetical protein